MRKSCAGLLVLLLVVVAKAASNDLSKTWLIVSAYATKDCSTAPVLTIAYAAGCFKVSANESFLVQFSTQGASVSECVDCERTEIPLTCQSGMKGTISVGLPSYAATASNQVTYANSEWCTGTPIAVIIKPGNYTCEPTCTSLPDEVTTSTFCGFPDFSYQFPKKWMITEYFNSTNSNQCATSNVVLSLAIRVGVCVRDASEYTLIEETSDGVILNTCSDSSCSSCESSTMSKSELECSVLYNVGYRGYITTDIPTYYPSNARVEVGYRTQQCTQDKDKVSFLAISPQDKCQNSQCNSSSAIAFQSFCGVPSFFKPSTSTSTTSSSLTPTQAPTSAPTTSTTVFATLTMSGDPSTVNISLILSAFSSALGVPAGDITITISTDSSFSARDLLARRLARSPVANPARAANAVFYMRVAVVFAARGEDASALRAQVTAAVNSETVKNVMSTQNVQVTDVVVTSSTPDAQDSSSSMISSSLFIVFAALYLLI